jgi:hypothetical protein
VASVDEIEVAEAYALALIPAKEPLELATNPEIGTENQHAQRVLDGNMPPNPLAVEAVKPATAELLPPKATVVELGPATTTKDPAFTPAVLK